MEILSIFEYIETSPVSSFPTNEPEIMYFITLCLLLLSV